MYQFIRWDPVGSYTVKMIIVHVSNNLKESYNMK